MSEKKMAKLDIVIQLPASYRACLLENYVGAFCQRLLAMGGEKRLTHNYYESRRPECPLEPIESED